MGPIRLIGPMGPMIDAKKCLGAIMDLQSILKTSRIFYRDHHLPSWRENLPKKAVVDEETAILEQASRYGFSHGFAFPAFHVQMDSLRALIEATVLKPAPMLPDNQ